MADQKFNLDKIDARLAEIYSSDENKLEKFDRWADHYESDLVEDLEYVAHIEASRIFDELVPGRSCRILDVACGTGLVGVELRMRGYDLVDGTDFSSEMLKIADQRKVYDSLFQHDFTTPLESQGRFDAVICVGMFSFNVPKILDMIHVIRAAKPEHYCVITVNGAAWRELNLGEQVEVESKRHGFTVEKIVEAGYIQNQNIDCRVLVIRSPKI